MNLWEQTYRDPANRNVTPEQWQQARSAFFQKYILPQVKGDESKTKEAWQSFNNYADQLSGGSDADSIVQSAAQRAIQEGPGAPEPEPEGTPGLYRFLKTMELPTYMGLGALGGPAGMVASVALGEQFNPLDKLLYENIRQKEQAKYKGMDASQAMKYDQRRSGVLSDLLDASSNSLAGRILYSMQDEDTQKKIEGVTPQGYQYQPKHDILHSVAGVGADLPFYAMGAAGGPGATFAFPATLRRLYEAKIKKEFYNPTFKELFTGTARERTVKDQDDLVKLAGNLAKTATTSYIEGLAIHGMGKVVGKVVDRIGLWRAYKKAGGAAGTDMPFSMFTDVFQGAPNRLASAALRVPAMVGTMTAVDQAAQLDYPIVGPLREERPFSWDQAKKDFILTAILEGTGLLGNRRVGPRVKDYKLAAEEVNKVSKELGLTRKETWEKMNTLPGRDEINQLYQERQYKQQDAVEAQQRMALKNQMEAEFAKSKSIVAGKNILDMRDAWKLNQQIPYLKKNLEILERSQKEALARGDQKRADELQTLIDRRREQINSRENYKSYDMPDEFFIKKPEAVIEKLKKSRDELESKVEQANNIEEREALIKKMVAIDKKLLSLDDQTNRYVSIAEENPPDMEPVVETIYPEGWDKKAKAIKPEAYSKQGQENIHENINNAVNAAWDIIKQHAEAEPGLMQRLSKNPMEYKEFFDPYILGEGAKSAWDSKRFGKSIDKKIKDLITKYSDADTWEQARQWQESEQPYQKLTRLARENTPEETPDTFQIEVQGKKGVVPQTVKLADTVPANEYNAVKMAKEQETSTAKEEQRRLKEAQSKSEEQVAIEREQQARVQQSVDLFNRSAQIREYGSKELSDKGFELFNNMKEKLNDTNNTIRDFMSFTPNQIDHIMSSLKFTDKYFVGPYHNGIGQWINNPSREVERVAPQLASIILPASRAAGMKYVLENKLAQDAHKKFRIDNKVTHQEGENIVLAATAMQEGGAEILRAMDKRAPVLTSKEQKVLAYIQSEMKDIIEGINDARKSVGLEPYNVRGNYLTFLRKFTLAEEMGWNPTFSDNWMAMEETPSPKGFSFQFGKERVKSARSIELDPFYILDRYAASGLRSKIYTPVIGKIREFIDNPNFNNPDNRNVRFSTVLDGMLDHMAGTRRTNEGEISYRLLDKTANVLNKGQGAFYLAWNLGTIAIQPAAYVVTFGEFGPKYAAKGLAKFMGSAAARKFAQINSNVLMSRVSDITIEEMRKGIHGKIGKAYTNITDWGTLPMRYVDYGTAMATWLAAHEYAKDVKGLTGKEAIRFADEKVVRTQGSADRIDTAKIQRTPVGKALTIFNTFTINQWNWLLKDVIGNENLTTSQKSMKLGRFIAGSMMANTVYEMMGYMAPPIISNTPSPAPLSVFYKTLNGKGFLEEQLGSGPFGSEGEQKKGDEIDAAYQALLESMGILPVMGGSFRYGGKSMYGAVGTEISELVDSMGGARGSKPMLYHAGKIVGVPGGQQMWKFYKAYKRSENQDKPETFDQSMRKINKSMGLDDFNKAMRLK